MTKFSNNMALYFFWVMFMVLYADSLFVVNFVMNSFVLWMVAKLARSKRKRRWLFLGAGVMALLYTLLIVVESLRFLNVALSSIIILSLGVIIGFYPQGIKSFFKIMAVAYCISFTVGGLGMALIFLTDLPHAVYHIASDWSEFTRSISWQIVFIGMAICYILLKLGIRASNRYVLKRQMLCNIQIYMGENGCSFEALVDTGHSLKEPLSQSPVIIAEFEHIKEFLPDGLKVLFYEQQENNFEGLLATKENANENEDEATFYHRIRMIPFSSVGRANGMLIGFRPDRVFVEGEKGKKCTPIDVVVAIYNAKLCRDGRYQGLVSPELVG